MGVKMKLLLLVLCATISSGDQTLAASLGCQTEDGKNYWGNDIHHEKVETLQACADLCSSTPGGLFWTWNKGNDKDCWVKSSDSGRIQDPAAVSGNRECGDQTAAAPSGDQTMTPSEDEQTMTPSEDDQTEGSGIGIDVRCHSNLFDEAVELLSTHTVERLEKQLLEEKNALKEKENENEMLKLELEKKQEEMEKSRT